MCHAHGDQTGSWRQAQGTLHRDHGIWHTGQGDKAHFTPPPCDIPSGCSFFTRPWTVTHSSLRVLRRGQCFLTATAACVPCSSGGRFAVFAAHSPPRSGRPPHVSLRFRVRGAQLFHPSTCCLGRPPLTSPRCHVCEAQLLNLSLWCTWALRAPSWFLRVSRAPPDHSPRPSWRVPWPDTGVGPTLDVEGGVGPWCVNKRRRGTLSDGGADMGVRGWAADVGVESPSPTRQERMPTHLPSTAQIHKLSLIHATMDHGTPLANRGNVRRRGSRANSGHCVWGQDLC